MGKIISVILGAVAALIGIILLLKWWDSFIMGVKAAMPVILIFGGTVSLIAGLSELKDELQEKKEKEEKK